MSDQLTDADLDAIEQRAAECGGPLAYRSDAVVIAEKGVPRLVAALRAERAENARLRDAVDAVQHLHRPDVDGSWCHEDGFIWPCATARALSLLDGAA